MFCVSCVSCPCHLISDSLYLSLTYSGAPGMTQSDPWVTKDDHWVTQDDHWVTQDDPWVTQDDP